MWGRCRTSPAYTATDLLGRPALSVLLRRSSDEETLQSSSSPYLTYPSLLCPPSPPPYHVHPLTTLPYLLPPHRFFSLLPFLLTLSFTFSPPPHFFPISSYHLFLLPYPSLPQFSPLPSYYLFPTFSFFLISIYLLPPSFLLPFIRFPSLPPFLCAFHSMFFFIPLSHFSSSFSRPPSSTPFSLSVNFFVYVWGLGITNFSKTMK